MPVLWRLRRRKKRTVLFICLLVVSLIAIVFYDCCSVQMTVLWRLRRRKKRTVLFICLLVVSLIAIVFSHCCSVQMTVLSPRKAEEEEEEEADRSDQTFRPEDITISLTRPSPEKERVNLYDTDRAARIEDNTSGSSIQVMYISKFTQYNVHLVKCCPKMCQSYLFQNFPNLIH